MNKLRSLFADRKVRITLIVIIIGATFVVFANYLLTHPEVMKSLVSLSPFSLLLLTLAYIGTIIANAFVLNVSLRMIGKPVPFSEIVSLTGYSSVVNFFGPLQSGPGFRAAYLKQRHNVNIKSFLLATIIFYGFFAVINGLVLLLALLAKASGALELLLLVVALAAVGAIGFTVYQSSKKARTVLRSIKLNSPYVWLIGLGALLLSACTTFAYYIELQHIDPAINLLQTTVYAAAANLALFVSLTPGAIGFRESFLLLSQQLHQIPTNVVLGASIIDRAFYVVFLLVLFICLLLFGARRKLRSINTR